MAAPTPESKSYGPDGTKSRGLTTGDALKSDMDLPTEPEPRRRGGALQPQRWLQKGATEGQRPRSRYWRARKRPHHRQRLHDGVGLRVR